MSNNEATREGPFWIRALMEVQVHIREDGEESRRSESDFTVDVSFDLEGLTDQDVRLILIDGLQQWARELEADYILEREEGEDD